MKSRSRTIVLAALVLSCGPIYLLYASTTDIATKLAKMQAPAEKVDAVPPDSVGVVLYGVHQDALNGVDGAAICDIGSIRLAILGQSYQAINDVVFLLDVPISGDEPESKLQRTREGIEYFAYNYENDEVNCKFFDLPFRIHQGMLYIGADSFPVSRAVEPGRLVVVGPDNQLLETRPLQPRTLRRPLKNRWQPPVAEETPERRPR